MASAKSIINELKGKDSWYDPDLDYSGLLPEGDYLAHISSLSVKKNVVIKNKFLADIYELNLAVDKENVTMVYDVDGKKTNGKAFVGRVLKTRGFFRFKKPDKTTYPDLSENMGSNRGYKEMVGSLGIPLDEKGGKFFLPELDESDVIGLPVIARVAHKSFQDKITGENVVFARVVQMFKWEDGARKIPDEDLPF